MRAPYRSLPHQVLHFAVLKVDFMSLNPVSLKLLTARNMRLVHNLQESLEFQVFGICPGASGGGENKVSASNPYSPSCLHDPPFFRTYPFLPKPSLHVHDVYLLGQWVGGSIKSRVVTVILLSLPCWVQFRSYMFLGKLEERGSSQGRAKRLKKKRKESGHNQNVYYIHV